jgi:hypothetical protein
MVMLLNNTGLLLILSAICFTFSCGKKNKNISIDDDNERTESPSPPPSQGGTDSPAQPLDNDKVSVEVDVKVRSEPVLNKQIVSAQSLLLPLYKEVQASSVTLATDFRVVLESLDLLVATRTMENQKTFCANLMAFETKLKAATEPADKLPNWIITISSVSAKEALCE